MSGQSTPIGMDLSEAAEKRNNMVSQCMERLQNFAYRGMHMRHLNNDQFVVVCIKVDSPWRDIVDMLMPNVDWQQYRDMGQEPVARGIATFNLCELLAERLPDIATTLKEKPESGVAKCVALDEGGCTVYDIKPVQEQEVKK